MHCLESRVEDSGDVLVTRRRHSFSFKAVTAGKLFNLVLKNDGKIIESMQKELNRLHFLAECTDICIVVEGPIGCGKTTLVQTYAESQDYHYGDNLVVIHLGEQIDSKMLLGTYTSTGSPGEFVWLPGVLTKAVTHGKWVLLEDIDRAPSDVVSILLPLIKERKLVIPGYSQPLQAASHFKLFLTQRYTEEGKKPISVHSSVLEQHCAILQLSALTQDEIKQILVKQYPHLQSIYERLLSTCSSLRLHLRYILKFCERISAHVHGGHVTSIEDLFLELIDCFAGHLSAENRMSLSMEFRPICGGIAKEKVEQLCMKRKPMFQLTPTTLTVGRAYLHYTTKELPRVYYAHTRSSLILLESVCRCVQMNEPVLLVGETGVGKTATIDYLSKITGNKLIVVNMSQQTESSDLLGGFKPVQLTQFLAPVREEFEQLFHSTFSVKHNAQFLGSLQVCYARRQWKKWFRLMLHSQESALKRVKGEQGNEKTSLHTQWATLGKKLRKLRKQLHKPQAALAFAFIEGTLVEAVQHGWWVLLDEINLASPETLQCLSSLLESSQGSFVVTERGDSKPVAREPNFRLFCCMNPATDVGKKQLPYIIRNRFTEFFVDEPRSTADLTLLVMSYLKSTSPSAALVDGIISLYRAIQELADNRLQDGTGRKPHYSLRSLCRALLYAASNRCGTLLRSLYEGFCMAFLTELRQDHHQLVIALIKQCLGISESYISASIPQPKGPGFIKVEGFWLALGSEATEAPPDYVLTESVKKNLKNLARVVSARCHPVLLQGPTSSGKTSLVQYLAKLTGHKCLRINNHEHTDLQEYVGMYTANSQGQLVFQEGILVNAMRKGYWIILDELNLAPTDVLEALNRVLDDNRELFIPETQQVVKAHSNFLLFGTQNPPGLYGGRKVLSRAFRNRFMELHYDDIPTPELVTILEKRSKLPQSYAKKMVAILKDLQQRRSSSGIFAGKYGLITLRDLFRWAERYRWSQSVNIFCDWEQQLAEDGYMLLGGRQRNPSEEKVILEVISKNFKRTVTPSKLFGYDGGVGSLASQQILEAIKVPLPSEFHHLVWTPELLRMAILVHRAMQFKEPVLLIGNTGCGKTTICQILASIVGQKFFSINCHMHTEAADFLGGLRPVRNRHTAEASREKVMFEWVDGVVLEAMKQGGCLLIDEISLADDAVLERLNSLLEPERKLLVSERSRQEDDVYELTAKKEFVFMATMNPGGDFGKKELSPALRNRFVEIWCPTFSERESFQMIIVHNLQPELKPPNSEGILWSSLMLDVMEWLQKPVLSTRNVFSIRDLLTWVKFMNITTPLLTPAEAFFHGAHLVFLDALGCGGCSVADHRQHITAFIYAQLKNQGISLVQKADLPQELDYVDQRLFGIHPFYIEKGPLECSALHSYSLKAPGPQANAYRLLRSMQLGRPLLLEGAPGVGKTSLVIALAKASGHPISRINLSEHTDINDLFGSDLPIEGGKGVNFAWRDGPLLRALKNGDWVLLDEMNLASQSVLEGLNACLDHRGEIYIPELGMTFKVQSGTHLFACQNPLQQGGGRKGLPKSFVNRFTQVYIDVLTEKDLLFITSTQYPTFDPDMLKKMIAFNSKVASLVTVESGSGLWEFNLRDVLRWCELLQTHQSPGPYKPEMFMDLVYLSRLRSREMRRRVLVLFLDVFECTDGPYCPPMPLGSYFHVSKEKVQIGHCVLKRENHYHLSEASVPPLMPLHCQMPVLEALMTCVKMGWMAILAFLSEFLMQWMLHHLCIGGKVTLSDLSCTLLDSGQEDLGWFSVFMLIEVLFLPTTNWLHKTYHQCPQIGFTKHIINEVRALRELSCIMMLADHSASLRGFENGSHHFPASKSALHAVDEPTFSPLLATTHVAFLIAATYLQLGGSSAGKYSTVSTLAQLTGHKLLHFPMNSDTDTTELLGGFEQLNFGRHCSNLASAMLDGATCLQTSVTRLLMEGQMLEMSVLQSYADTLSTLVTNLREKFSPAVCIEDSGREKLTDWCDELEETLKQLKSISDVPGLHLSYDWDEVSQELQHLAGRMQESNITGQFEWVDSVLVRALKYGHWLLISNANFCSPSVLDRLNPLLEPNGSLSIDERGIVGDAVPTIMPHPNFRLFLTVNPAHGEISRAMRNRGVEICILPKDSISAIEYQKEDWIKLLAGCDINDSEISHRLLEICLNSPRISPKHVQHAAKCYQFLHNSGHEDPLSRTAYLIQGVNISATSYTEVYKQEFPIHQEPISVLDYILYPSESTVLRDVTPFLRCLNTEMKEIGSNVGTHILELSTSLEVFVSSATVEDCSIRLSLLEQLESLLYNRSHVLVELKAWSAALKAVMEHSNVLSMQQELKQFGNCIDGLLATSNPHLSCVTQQKDILIKAEWVHLLARIVALYTLLQEHSQLANCGAGKMSVIQLSYQTHTGILPLENIPHPSLASLYPVLLILCRSLMESIDFNKMTSLKDLQKSIDWISVFIRMFMGPGCSLSHLAVAWSLLNKECLKTVQPVICQHSDLNVFQTLLENLEILDSLTAEGMLSGSLRAALGHPSPPCSHDAMSIKALIISKDLELREQKKTKLPFFILFNEPLHRRKLLSQAICQVYGMEVQKAEIEVESVLEGRRCPIQGAASPQSNIRHPALLASAIHPAAYCLKHLAIELLSESVLEVALRRRSEVKALVAYCLQLSFIGLHELEPLVVWQECTAENVDMSTFLWSMFPRILESCCTGFNVCSASLPLLDQPEQRETVLPLLSESACTKMAFYLLAPSDDTASKLPTLSIGNVLSKKDELKTLLQHIWLHGCCEVYNQSSNIWLEWKLTNALLKLFLHGIRKAVTNGTEMSVKHGPMEEKSFPDDISSFQLAVTELLSLDCIPEAWREAEPHLIAAHGELANVQRLFCYETDSDSLQLLCSLNSARAYLGIAMGLILCPPPVDPVSVAAVHYQCYQQLKDYTGQLLDACDIHYHMMVGRGVREQCMCASDSKTDPIPHVGTSLYVDVLFKRERVWTETLRMMPSAPVKRLDEAKYFTLVNVCVDIMKTLCSSKRIKSILATAERVVDDPSALLKVISWSKAIASGLEKIKENFETFPDIVEPFVLAIRQVMTGVNSLAWVTAHKANLLQGAIGHIAQFPFFNTTTQGRLELFKEITSIATSNIQGLQQPSQVQKKLIQVAAGICAYSIEFLSDTSLSWREALSGLLELCWSLWLQADEQARVRAKEEESLYRYKARTHQISMTEDAAEDEQLSALFPSYDREFFTEIDVLDEQASDSTLGEHCDIANHQQQIASPISPPHEIIISFSMEEMATICNIHLLMYSKSYKFASQRVPPDFPIQDIYNLASNIYGTASSIPGMSTDYYLMGSHARMCKTVLESQLAGKNNKMSFNIHKDPLPLEAQKVLPILTELQSRVQELLNEWPGHPGLQQINKACEKVLLLSVDEPLMKILSGLEYVLKKAQDWEAYASSHVSLYNQLEALTLLILDWRRLELNSWKHLLSFCTAELRMCAAKWWFHFYSLCKSEIDKLDSSSESDTFIGAVQKFMETSTLGEFPYRLYILDAFEADMLEKGYKDIASILSNAFIFYGQFLCTVDTSIQQLTGPLQRDFKEFLSILRWNDSNYWALKVTTEKSHRNLVKFMNKYKAVLNQPVLPLLTDSSLGREAEEEDSGKFEEESNVGTLSRLEQLIKADVHLNKLEQTLLYQYESSDEVSVVIQSEGETLEISGSDALHRLKELVHKFKSVALCSKWSVALDRFTGDLITTTNDLQSTDFLTGLEGDKRKAAIKLSGVQKRKSVGDLFKALKLQGLSYRRGVEFSKNFRVVAFRLPAPQPNMDDPEYLWKDIQKYYYLCVARMAGLEAALVVPSKELTVGQISRCKGYASQLMTSVCEQRAVLSKALDDSSTIMHAVERLHLVIKTETKFVPPDEFRQWQSTLCSNLEQCLEAVSSFAELIATMPEHLDFSLTPLRRVDLPPIVAAGDRTLASTALSALDSHLTELKELYAVVVTRERRWAKFTSHFATLYEIDELKKGFLAVEKFSVSIGDTLSLTMGEQKRLGMLEFLGALQKQLESSCQNFFQWVMTVTDSPIHETSFVIDYQEQANQLMKVMLLGLQRVMTRHQDSCSIFNTESGEGGQRDYMYCKSLHLFVTRNLQDFKCAEVLQELQILLKMTPDQASRANDAKKIVSAIYPLICHYVSLHEKLVFDLMIAHRTMCRLLSVLLQTFCTLVSKGFCTPPEFTETENGSGGTEFVDIEAGGFDEGEGKKNVSSEVNPESLDATQSQSSKQQEEDNRDQQHEREEEAVEMPEDFEGALEDVKREGEEGEESEESEGEEEPDRQMGQLGGEESEQLDRNMWAPEEEQEEEDQVKSPEKQEQGGGTATEDETRIVAKDDSQGHKESGESPKEEKCGEESLEDQELGEGEGDDEGSGPNTDFQEPPDSAKDEEMEAVDLGDLNLEDGEDGEAEDESVAEETLKPPSGAEEEGEDMQMEGEVLQGSEAEEEEQHSQHDKIYATETMDISKHTGVEPNTAEPNTTTSELKASEDVTEGQFSDVASNAAGGRSTETSSTAQPNEPREESGGLSQRKPHSRPHEDRSLADSEERAIKRPKLMDSHLMPPNKENIQQQKKESTLYQHIKDSQEHDAVAWDAAPLNQQGLPHKPLDESVPESDGEEDMEDTSLEEPTDPLTSNQALRQLGAGEVTTDSPVPMELEHEDQEAEEEGAHQTKERRHLSGESFYATGKMLFLQQKQLDQDNLRESLKTSIAVLHSKEQSLDASELWLKYEQLTSALSQMLCEELRLILQPTRAAQLKGDYRTGKRLNMRRIIPYIASNFQNNRIWLRRTKPSKREYQILIAVDDSSSMNENECNQMAYESMALISNALSRLDCGQLGICRFGESVEVLHPLDQPFSTATGGHILQHLTFTQAKTNFVQLLQAVEPLFVQGLSHFSGSHSSPEISQLLVVLSDGRGVFADGTLAVETAVRRLNELGIFTVFVILDSLSKDSIVDIKVPTFIQGKPPVIKSYLETFPFPFYIVLRDVKILPSVMGQALRQWFELVSNKTTM